MSIGYRQSPIRRIARTVVDIVEECNYAQRRLFELRLDPERYVLTPSGAPDTYAEFLYLTSGFLRHEPTARERATGTDW